MNTEITDKPSKKKIWFKRLVGPVICFLLPYLLLSIFLGPPAYQDVIDGIDRDDAIWAFHRPPTPNKEIESFISATWLIILCGSIPSLIMLAGYYLVRFLATKLLSKKSSSTSS